jgi:hypothetical protein
MKCVVLRNCGNFAGLFQTEPGAKARAQQILNEYWEMYDDMEPDELEDSEPLTTKVLEWKVERINYRGLPTGSDEIGWERPVARYAEQNGYFTLTEEEVGP